MLARCFALALLAAACLAGRGATTNLVRMGNYFFTPTNLTINAGDTVTWSNTVLNPPHDTTGPTNLWASSQFASPNKFSFTFTNAGSYPYVCAIHVVAHPEQTGLVSVVSAPNLPPTVSITNPANGAVFSAPATFALAAAAADSDGSVTQVQFFRGPNSLGIDTTSPYSVPVSGLGAGTNIFSAVATDNAGARATNAITVIVTNSAATGVTITNLSLQGSQLKFFFGTQTGRTYTVERSTVLPTTNWLPLTNFIGTGTNATILDSTTGTPARFYRVGAQ